MLLIARLTLLAGLHLGTNEAARSEAVSVRQATEDVQLLKEARVPVDGPALVAFLRGQNLTAADEEHIRALVRQLTSAAYRLRDRAGAELARRGPAALPLLSRAFGGADLEAQRRLKRVLDTLENTSWDRVGAAAARRLRALRPEGACAALLAYLPFVEEAEEETLAALRAVGGRAGKPDAAFEAALRDGAPARRAAAALVLAQYGDARQRAAVRRVMASDLHYSVRLRAAEGLLEAGDTSGVPVLLAILADGRTPLLHRAEELLRLLAGENLPAVARGNGPILRSKLWAGWQQWWDANAGKLTLPPEGLSALRAAAPPLARKTAERFLKAALFAPNRDEFRKTTAVPCVFNGNIYKTRAELDALFEKTFKTGPTEDAKRLRMKVKHVLRLQDYQKRTPLYVHAIPAVLRSHHGQPILVVVLNLDVVGSNFNVTVPLFVRVGAVDARVIALGHMKGN